MDVPAICRKCGYAFESGFEAKDAFNVTLKGNTVYPCPNCGGVGDVIDGVFNFYKDTIEIVSAPNVTKQELAKLKWIFVKYDESTYSKEKISEEIESQVPKLNRLVSLLPQTREEKRSDIKFALNAVLAIIGLFFGASQANINIDVDLDVNEILEEFYQENNSNL